MNWLTRKLELVRSGAAANDRAMEGVRGFAVLLVFLVHYGDLVEPWIRQQASLVAFSSVMQAIGNTGVDLFFVLSGYLIYGSLMSRPQRVRSFLARRLVRVYPAFTAVFVVYVILSFFAGSGSKIPTPASAGLVYLMENYLLLPGIFPIRPLITVAWSLSYEFCYYLLLPLVIWMFDLRRRSPAWRVRFFCCLAVALTAACAWQGGPVRLAVFIVGILIFEARQSSKTRVPSGAIAALALCGGFASVPFLPQDSLGNALKVCVLFVSFLVFGLSCFQDALGWLARAFAFDPLRWLGNMSYSYYLIHGLTLKLSFALMAAWLEPGSVAATIFWPLLPVMFGVSLVPALILFLSIERPFSLARKPSSRQPRYDAGSAQLRAP